VNALLTLLVGVAFGVGLVVLRGVLVSPRRSQRVTRRLVADRKISTAPQARDLVEAIAVWTEQLRDTISASTGLEQAILATQNHAPPILLVHVQKLTAGIRYGSTDSALRTFADDVAHPTCDFVVAALITSTQHQARDVAQLLTHLSECAREECRFYLRMWVSRARTRTATRLISSVVIAFVTGLLILDPAYLAPFATTEGVVFLALALSCFACALVMLRRLGRISMPSRFLSGRVQAVAT
jgi:hypothetical protein